MRKRRQSKPTEAHVSPLIRSYRERNKTVKKLGFTSYAAYLQSDLWAGIRIEILQQNSTCIRCGEPATQVHHAFYSLEVLNGTDRSKLYSICGDCHQKAEFDHLGRKTTVGRANRFLGIIKGRQGKWTGKPNTTPQQHRKSPANGTSATIGNEQGELLFDGKSSSRECQLA